MRPTVHSGTKNWKLVTSYIEHKRNHRILEQEEAIKII